ncbi:hypothetical protein G7Z17_g9139 [Cylindrodendrum hubeiense]|uniref:RRM domain-containing protein n=1 Tax=Cylindrodendrum hubeiense TaxID=595255 RepID=A0A9P5LE02_9HYPO|nr:hypothetical protein G7Z17_g9139 [Cylindrodendrum hubeiense]
MSTTTLEVGPGDQTGTYYIPIANLPFDITWAPLKDWISFQVEVDRVEVFPASTSGWVRVKGRANFEKAFKLLNGGAIYQGRALIADDANRTNPIWVKQGADSSSPGDSPASPYRTSPPARRESDIWGVLTTQSWAVSRGQHYPRGYIRETAANYAGQPVAVHDYSSQPSMTTVTGMPTSYVAMDSGNYYNYGDQASGTASIGQFASAYPTHYRGGYQSGYQSEGAQFTVPYHGRTEPQAYTEGYATSGATQPHYRATEQRKLHISSFPQQANLDEVKSWIRRKAGPNKITTLDVPQNSNSRYLRGHAFAIFDNSAEAAKAMDQLNKARFQGRRVTAKPAKEGVTDLDVDSELMSSEPVIPTGPSRDKESGHYRSEKGHRSKQTGSGGSDKKRSSSDKKLPSSSDKKISSSSDKKLSSSPDKKVSSSNKTNEKKSSPPKEKSNKDSGPVIADGSSRKREKR